MSILDNLRNRLVSYYNTHPDSNISKLLSILADEITEIRSNLEDTDDYRNLNEVLGETLDYIGSNVQQPRRGWNDEQYRKYIKTRIASNLSGGEIETFNEVLNVLLENNYLGVEETWNNPQFDNEIAAVAVRYIHDIFEGGMEYKPPLTFDGEANFDGEYLFTGRKPGDYANTIFSNSLEAAERIKAGGVRLYWIAFQDFIIDSESELTFDWNIDQSVSIRTHQGQLLNGDSDLDGEYDLDSQFSNMTGQIVADYGNEYFAMSYNYFYPTREWSSEREVTSI